MNRMRYRNLICLLIPLILIFSCREDSESPKKVKISGVIEKGPFVTGGEVRAQNLDNDLHGRGALFVAEVSDNRGRYAVDINSGYVGVVASGIYYDEIAGKNSKQPITLRAFGQVTTDTILNLNVLTTLSFYRIKHLITEDKKSYAEAVAISQKEVLKIFKIELDEQTDGFDQFAITAGDRNGSILLAVSSLLLYSDANVSVSELLDKISDDIAPDGILDDAAIKNLLNENGKKIDATKIRTSLINYFSSLGITVNIPDFSPYVDSDGDGSINLHNVARPQFDQAPGEYPADMKVALTCSTPGATIYYTLDGTDPTSSSPVYTEPIDVTGDYASVVIKAMATKATLGNSEIVTGHYSLSYPQLPLPYFNLSTGGFFYNDIVVTAGSLVEGVTIHYEYNNAAVNGNSPVYDAPFEVLGPDTRVYLCIVATKEKYRNSDVNVQRFDVKYNLQPPLLSLPANAYASNIAVELTASASEETIHYTLDGSDPTLNSPLYTGPIAISGDGTEVYLKTRAFFKTLHNENYPTAIATSFYKISSAAGWTTPVTGLTVANYNQMITGDWIGALSLSGGKFRNLSMEITGGKMIATILSPANSEAFPGYTPPEYPFLSEDLGMENFYVINTLLPDGRASGVLGNVALDKVQFSDDGDYLSFEITVPNYGTGAYHFIRKH